MGKARYHSQTQYLWWEACARPPSSYILRINVEGIENYVTFLQSFVPYVRFCRIPSESQPDFKSGAQICHLHEICDIVGEGKGKVIYVLNLVPCHEDVLGTGSIR
jgi:hypothetical protein